MNKPLRIGILGGGQLGRMLLQAAANYHVETFVLETGNNPPSASLCHHFIEGDIRDFDAVYNFGKKVDVLTIEIENVNLEALFKLEEEGLNIIPRPAALRTIKDKGLQKDFYLKNNIPTSPFVLTETKNDINSHEDFLPAAHKVRTGGYDGKGVEILNTTGDFHKAFDAPSVLEKLVDIEKEISVITAINEKGEVAVYPPVEMVFDPKYNLVDYLLSPAQIDTHQSESAQQLALNVARALKSPGVFAVEMFIDKAGQILVNETAPRAHNSGHQSIEGNFCSQYDMQMRIFQKLPLGNTDITHVSMMINLVGESEYSGPVKYQGLEDVLSMKGTYIHLYGKTETKPGRKMGHITLLGNNAKELIQSGETVKQTVKVISD